MTRIRADLPSGTSKKQAASGLFIEAVQFVFIRAYPRNPRVNSVSVNRLAVVHSIFISAPVKGRAVKSVDFLILPSDTNGIRES